MSDRFALAVSGVLRAEGGYVNDPADPGGETKFGISKAAYPALDIAALTEDGAILIWDMYNAPEEPTPLDLDDAFDAFAFAPRGDVLAAACGSTVRLYDWRRTEQLDCSIEASGQVLSLKFSPDGRSLAVGCDDGRVQIWKVR